MICSVKRLEAHIAAARIYAELSYAQRLKVCAIAVKDDRPILNGINGTPPGADNMCEEYINGNIVTKKEVSHAEANLIARAAKLGVSLDNTAIVCTHSPCFECAKLLVNAGVRWVYYDKEYRDLSGAKFLKVNKVKVIKIGE